MRKWHVVAFMFLLAWATARGFGQQEQTPGSLPRPLTPFSQARQRHSPIGQEGAVDREKEGRHCREWKNGVCTVCAVDSAIALSLQNKTKTPILFCRDMKPGPAKLMLSTHAEPVISGIWEIEFGLGYQTSARDECPHQFIASNNPPLKNAYDIGPVTIEGEIPPDGIIQAVACVGLSSARVGQAGKESAVSLRAVNLRVVAE